MKTARARRRIAASAFILISIGGCLGPNPGFFVSSTAAGAAIQTLVGQWITSLLNAQ